MFAFQTVTTADPKRVLEAMLKPNGELKDPSVWLMAITSDERAHHGIYIITMDEDFHLDGFIFLSQQILIPEETTHLKLLRTLKLHPADRSKEVLGTIPFYLDHVPELIDFIGFVLRFTQSTTLDFAECGVGKETSMSFESKASVARVTALLVHLDWDPFVCKVSVKPGPDDGSKIFLHYRTAVRVMTPVQSPFVGPVRTAKTFDRDNILPVTTQALDTMYIVILSLIALGERKLQKP